jgi:hypothetical protein
MSLQFKLREVKGKLEASASENLPYSETSRHSEVDPSSANGKSHTSVDGVARFSSTSRGRGRFGGRFGGRHRNMSIDLRPRSIVVSSYPEDFDADQHFSRYFIQYF